RPPVPLPDLDAIMARLRARPGTEALRVRSPGGGILELVGSAPDELDLPAVLDALAGAPGGSRGAHRAGTSRSAAPWAAGPRAPGVPGEGAPAPAGSPGHRALALPRVAGAGVVPRPRLGRARAGARSVRDRHPPAQRDGRAPHGARAQQHPPGRARPLAAHAGARRRMAP